MSELRAVTLDAAGTMIEVAEPVGATYARLAARHGISLDPADAERRFRAALDTAPPLAFAGGSPLRLADHERAWWYAVVRQTFGVAAGNRAFDACFDELFAHYGGAEAWRVFADAPPALERMRAHGLRLAVVSNFDGRLVPLLDALGVAALVDRVVHSTRAGAAKPDPAIFAVALAELGVAPAEALHVGDRLDVDVDGARAAGMRAMLLDRHGHAAASSDATVVPTLTALADLVARG